MKATILTFSLIFMNLNLHVFPVHQKQICFVIPIQHRRDCILPYTAKITKIHCPKKWIPDSNILPEPKYKKNCAVIVNQILIIWALTTQTNPLPHEGTHSQRGSLPTMLITYFGWWIGIYNLSWKHTLCSFCLLSGRTS